MKHLKSTSLRAHFIFWLLTLTVAISTRYIAFNDLDDEDILVVNQLPGMDMEKFLNWARIMKEHDRWLSDFDTSKTGVNIPYSNTTYHQSPLYPYFLALLADIFDFDLDGIRHHYTGGLDEVRLYNRSFSKEDVRHLAEFKDPAPGNLMSYWSFNALNYNQVYRDYSQHGHNATQVNHPSQNEAKDSPRPDDNQRSIQFDGDQNQSLHVENTFYPNIDFTFSAYINPVNTQSDEQQTLFCFSDASTIEKERIELYIKRGHLYFQWGPQTLQLTQNQVLSDDVWQHIVVARKQNEIGFFLNGKGSRFQKIDAEAPQLSKPSLLFGATYDPNHNRINNLIMIQYILGILLLWPLHQIIQNLSNLSTSRIATFLFTFSQLSVFYESMLLRASLLALLYVLVVHHLLMYLRNRNKMRAFLSGVFMGLAWLCKPSFVVFVPMIVLWLYWQRPKETYVKTFLAHTAIKILGIALTFLPFVYRNIIINELETKRIAYENSMRSNKLDLYEKELRKLKSNVRPANINRIQQLQNDVKELKNSQGTPLDEADTIPLLKLSTRGPYAYVNGNSYHAFNDGKSITYPGSTKGLGYDIVNLKNNHYANTFYKPASAFAKRTFGDDLSDDEIIVKQNSLTGTMRMVWHEHGEKSSWWSRFIPMMFNKSFAFFNGLELPNNSNLYLAKKFAPSLNLFFITPFVVCTVFVMSLIVLAPQWRRPEISLLMGFILIYFVTTVIFYFIGRFRFPVIPLMYLCGVLALHNVVTGINAKKSSHWVLVVSLVLFAMATAWPRDVRGGLYQEAYATYGGIRLNDYHNHSVGKSHQNKWDDMLRVSSAGLMQPEGSKNNPLWHSFFKAASKTVNTNNKELIDIRRKICRLYWEFANSNNYNSDGPPPAIVNDAKNLIFLAYYAYCIDQLYLEAKEKKNKRDIKRFARLGMHLHRLPQSRHITNVRQQHKLMPMMIAREFQSNLPQPKDPK